MSRLRPCVRPCNVHHRDTTTRGAFMHKQTAVVRLPLEGPIFALVEDWRRSQSKIPSRNEAIRLLLRRALERPPEKEARKRA